MVDIKTIRENYTQMADFQLMLAAKDGQLLSQDAFIILKREIKKRGLDATILQEQEEIRVENRKVKIRQNLDREYIKNIKKIWFTALDKKANGHSNNELRNALKQEGLNPEDAEYVIDNLPVIAENLMQVIKGNINAGFCWIGGALLAITIMVVYSNTIWGFYYLAAVIFIKGGILVVISLAEKQKMEKIITKIQMEKAAQPKGNML